MVWFALIGEHNVNFWLWGTLHMGVKTKCDLAEHS